MPEAVALITQVLVAQRRIGEFLAAEELVFFTGSFRNGPVSGPVNVRTAAVAADGHGSVLLRGVSVQWRLDAAVPPALSGLDLRAEVG